MAITKGSIYRATLDVYDATGALVNPATATVTIVNVKPDGTVITTTPAVTLPPASTGHLLVDFTTVEAGRHTGFWSTTAPTTTGTFVFEVLDSVSTGLVSRADMKLKLNLDPTYVADDAELDLFILVATDIIEDKVGNVVVRTVTTHADSDQQSLWLTELPVVSLISILPELTFGVSYPVSLVKIIDAEHGQVARLDGFPFVGGPFLVTYQTGRPVVKASITHGAKEIITHLWETQRGGLSVRSSGPGPESDDEIYAFRGKEYTVPRRVLELLQPSVQIPRCG
jgi:hypothetical protein